MQHPWASDGLTLQVLERILRSSAAGFARWGTLRTGPLYPELNQPVRLGVMVSRARAWLISSGETGSGVEFDEGMIIPR